MKDSLFTRYIELGVAKSRDRREDETSFRLNHKSKSLNIKNLSPDVGRGKMLFVNNTIKFRHPQEKSPKMKLNNIKVNASFFLK